MTLRYREAVWLGDTTKQTRLKEIVLDPVFQEAVDLVLAEHRGQYQNTRLAASDLLYRRECESGGMQLLLDRIDHLSRPPEVDRSSEFQAEWEHLQESTTENV